MQSNLEMEELEEIRENFAQEIEYLGLDIRMTHIRFGKKFLVIWRIHDKGKPNKLVDMIAGHPDIATFQLFKWVKGITLPENM